MTLKKEDFTEEQWAEIQADIDRARTVASSTARKNAETELAADTAAKIKAAIEEERVRLEADEQGKLEIERKKLEVAQAALAADRKSLAASKKLVAAGFGEDDIANLLPLFTVVDDKVFDSTIDSFVKVNQGIVKSQVDAAKVELLNAATPPVNPTGAPVDTQTAANELLKTGNDAAAVDLLLGAAGQ